MATEKVLGPLGQITPTYTLLTLGFALENESQQAPVIKTLERAANQIIKAYPWLAGQVVNEGAGEGNSGLYKIVTYELHEGSSRFVRVKDCRDLCPSYSELVKARAPTSMLDGSILSPEYGFVNDYPREVVKPVCIMQANLINGGILLTICTFHCVMDANGNDQLIRQFASLCRGEQLSEEYIRMGNADQDTIVPPLKPGQEPANMDMIRAPSRLGAEEVAWPPPPSGETWRTYRCPRASIAALKAEAAKLCSPDSDIKYISSNDAVSTFLWTRLAAARSAWLPKESKTSLIRAVNGRKKLDTPVHEGYMGHLVLCVFTTVPVEDAVKDPLSVIAIKVRRSLGDVDDHAVRSFFHLLQQEKDKTTINYGAKMNSAADVVVTSWVAQKLYGTSFGDILGKPDFVRRPKLPDAPSLWYLMPLTREGDIDAIASIPNQEFEALQADPKWREFVEFLG
jgi:trichothecene 3-O-acetyltransferase